MSVLLTILKILGILLLVILGLIIFVLLIVLLVPIRYRAQGSMQDGEKPELMAAVTWLYPTVSVKAEYSEKLDFSLKLLGITIYPKKKADPKESDMEDSQSESSTDTTAELQDNKPATVQKEEQITVESSENSGEKNKDDKITNDKDKAEASKDKSSSGFIEKLQSLRSKADFYMDILTADDTRSFTGKVFQTLLKILKSVSPKNIKANVTVGLDDPAATANILAIHGMLYPWIGENVNINADFDRKVLEGEFFLKGHIRSVALLFHILRIILDRRFHRLISQLKKGGKTDDRK